MEFSNLTTIFAQGYYAIPDYQRDYEWSSAQNGTLIEDVFSIIKDPASAEHFIGAIVTIPYEEDTGTNKSLILNEYSINKDMVKHIVDGQQRLTSLSILIQALWDCINEDADLNDTQKQRQGQDKLKPLLKGNDYNSSDDLAPKLILNGNTGKYYNSSIIKVNNDNGVLIYRGAKRIKAAYDFFKKYITEEKMELINNHVCNDANDYYKQIADVLVKKIILVEIQCSASSNAFQVFDSLNGKGLDLTAADRIKNILLSWCNPRSKGSQKWDSLVALIGEDYLTNFFVSVFFASKGIRISKNKLPDVFKETYKDSAVSDFDYFFNDIFNKGELYGKLRKSNTGNETNNSLINDLIQLNSDQVFVLLFASAVHYGEDIISKSLYGKLIKALLNLVVRMQVCEKSTNRLDSIFSKCIELMNNGSSSLNVIIQKINSEMKLLADDNEFKASFMKFAPADSKIGEYYLRCLEEYARVKNGNRQKVERGLTVEHIIPQAIDDPAKWYGNNTVPEEILADFKNSVIERIGNKMLLYGDDNSSAGNNDYKHKMDVYINGKRGQNQGTPVGTFVLAAELINNYPVKFNHEEVDKRAEKLADLAINIWN